MRPPNRHRRSTRLPGYDYAQPGAYFVTTCTRERQHLLGEIIDGEMVLSSAGVIADECWREIPDHFPGVALDAFVVMPNHVHGIVIIDEALPATSPPAGATHGLPLRAGDRRPGQIGLSGPGRGSLGAIVGLFKASTSKRINRSGTATGLPLWQRNYWEHVIRSPRDLDTIRQYIARNPLMWDHDVDNLLAAFSDQETTRDTLTGRFDFAREEADLIIELERRGARPSRRGNSVP